MVEAGLHLHTLHPGLPGLGIVGQFLLQGPYFPLLELQARWIVSVFAGTLAAPGPAAQAPARPPVESHDALASALAQQAGVAPDLTARPELAEPLLFGPMLPPRYRLDGPGALPGAADAFRSQLDSSPRDPVAPEDLEALRQAGRDDLAELVVAHQH